MRKITSLLLSVVLFASTFLIGCQSPEEQRRLAQENFDAYMETLFQDSVTGDFLSARFQLKDLASYGADELEVSLGDPPGETVFADYRESLSGNLKELQRFNYEALREDQQETYEILKAYWEFETEVSDSRFDYMQNIFSPSKGLIANFSTNFIEYPFYTEKDFQDCITLANQTKAYFEGMLLYLERQKDAGYFMADAVADEVIEQCRLFVEDPDNNALVVSFRSRIGDFEGISDEKKQTYIQEFEAAVKSNVIPAYTLVMETLEEWKGSGSNQEGLYYYENGKEYYEALVQQAIGTDISVKELKSQLEQQLQDTLDEYMQLVQQDPQVFDRLDDLSSGYDDFDDMLEGLWDAMQADFPAIKEVDYEVQAMDPSLAKNGNAAYYLIPPLDAETTNRIKVNMTEFSQNSKDIGSLSVFTTVAHEGFPGHMYMNNYIRQQNLPKIRQSLSFLGYSEGYATYVEKMAYFYSQCTDEIALQLLVKNDILTFSAVMLCDIGIHYEGWSREDMTLYLAQLGFDPEQLDPLYTQLLGDPALFMPYYGGYMEIMELREYAAQQLGDQFDLQEFHEALLQSGEAPFSVVEENINEYVQRKKSQQI